MRRARDELEFRDLMTIRAFWGLLEAQLAKGLLDSAGIESFLFDDNMVRMDWFNANALGGVKLRVDAHNVEAANRVLAAGSRSRRLQLNRKNAESSGRSSCKSLLNHFQSVFSQT